MSDSYPVYRLTQEAYDQLRLAAEEDPESYLDPAIDFGAVLAVRGVSNYVEETEITTNRPIALTPVADGSSPNRADRQALDFYRSFDGMNPRQATDERLWAWMTHFRLHAYGLERWRRPANVNMKNYVRSHWFSSGSTDAFWRHNTASRTWWMAHTALKAAQGAAGSFSGCGRPAGFCRHCVLLPHSHVLQLHARSHDSRGGGAGHSQRGRGQSMPRRVPTHCCGV